MQDINELKITEAEKARLLIKNANNRPNAMATYGQAKKSSSDVKDMFDKQFEFIAGRFNKFCEAKSEEQSEIIVAEQSRASAELVREKAEVVRAEAEIARVTAEDNRKTAEDARKEADKTRNDFLGDLDKAVGDILEIQDAILNGNAELVAREEVIKAINETLLIADDLETDDPYKALSAAQGVVLKALADSATKTVSGWYNGTNTTTTTLTFSFVPKVILIAEKSHFFEIGSLVSGYGMARRGCAVLFPEKSVLFHQFHGITSEKDTSVMNGMSVDVGKITLNGESVTIDRGGCLNSFNVQSTVGTNSDNAVTAKEEDGYGYWYFAIG